MIKKIIKNKEFIFTIILSIISILFSIILFRKGLLRGHDIEFHLSRIEGLRDSIKCGNFIALIHNGLYGYGYANGLFYGNLFIYFPAILSLMGLSLEKSYVLFITACNILTAFSMYYSVKRISKSENAAFISSLIYLLSPYRICDIVVRAAVGEVLAMMIIPIILLGFYEIVAGDHKKWWIFSIGYVLLIQAHLISTIVLTILLFILLIINIDKFIKEKKRILSITYSVILGLLLGSFFIFPLLEQYKFSELVVNNLSNEVNLGLNSIKFERIFLGVSYFSEGVFHPPGIGLIFIISCFFRYKIKTEDKKLLKVADTCMIVGLILLLMITPLFPWKEFSKELKVIQFPWRLYMFSTIFLSISSGLILYLKFRNNIKTIIYITIYAIGLFIVSIPFNFHAVHNYWGVGGMEYIGGYSDYYVANGEYLPYKTDINKLRERGEVITSNNDIIKVSYTKKGNKMDIKYSNNLNKNTYLELPLLYYLGYGTNKDYKLKAGNNNVIRVYLDKEKDNFIVSYKGTKIQKTSYTISLLTLVVATMYLLICVRRKRHDSKNRKNT